MPKVAKGMKPLNVYFPPALIDAARDAAERKDSSLSKEVRKTLERLAGWKQDWPQRGRPKKSDESC